MSVFEQLHRHAEGTKVPEYADSFILTPYGAKAIDDELTRLRAQLAEATALLRELRDGLCLRKWREYQIRGEERVPTPPVFIQIETCAAIDTAIARSQGKGEK